MYIQSIHVHTLPQAVGIRVVWTGKDYGSVAFMWMNYTRLIRTISSTKTNHSDKCNKWFIPQ